MKRALEPMHGSTAALRQLLLAAERPVVILVGLSDAPNQSRLRLLEEARQLKARIKTGQYREAFTVQILENARITEFTAAVGL